MDEALAVGDAVFANRCVRKFEELRERKITVLFVSHDLGLVKQLSDRAILLLNGRIEAQGTPNDVINRYIGLVLERSRRREQEGRARPRQLPPRRRRQRDPERRDPQRARRAGRLRRQRRAGHGPRALALPSRRRRDPMVGILIRTRIGMDVYGTNTRIEQIDAGRLSAGRRTGSRFPIRMLAHAAAIHTDRRHAESPTAPATTGWTTRSPSTWWIRAWPPAWPT